jgi:LmbE family N-acetylglucosaminyl deacetylase
MELLKDAFSKNVVVALIGDHGPYAQYQSKLPLGSLLLTSKTLRSIPRDVLRQNQDRLVSQYDIYKSLRYIMAQISTSHRGVDANGKRIALRNTETDSQRDKYTKAVTKTREKVVKFRVNIDSLDIKQLTRYRPYEDCTPPEASAQFCVCNLDKSLGGATVQKPRLRANRHNRTLLIVAHPDDEAVFFGNDITPSTFVIVVTNANSYGTGAHRREISKKAMKTVGVEDFEFWDFPESPNWRVSVKEFWTKDTRNSVRKKLVRSIRKVKPTQIYTHGRLGEYGHINHREIYDAVHAAFREVFDCNSDLSSCTLADPPEFFVFKPLLDYSYPTSKERLDNLPQTCVESSQRKLMLDTYVKGKALSVHTFHKMCLGFERMFPMLSQPPVDIVIPWSGERAGDVSGINRNDGTIRYTIRSMLKYMPWVRTIYIFADPLESPKWLTEFGANVQLVNRCVHFIGGSANCPTQNTFAVYANFHTIPGLAEHFIACDDDVIISSPLTREHFFLNGKVVQSLGRVSEIYSNIKYEEGIAYVTELTTPYKEGGKRKLPTKLPKQVSGVMHTAYPLLKSKIRSMQTEYPDWFDFVSSHRLRFCYHSSDKHQPGNVNGACWHENSKYAIMWYMQSKGLVTTPQKGQKIPEYSATYADITKHRLSSILTPGKHATVNINDSTMWKDHVEKQRNYCFGVPTKHAGKIRRT